MTDQDPQAQHSSKSSPKQEKEQTADKGSSKQETTQTAAEPSAAERIQVLERELAEAVKKGEDNWNQFLRARAEADNIRRRAERDIEHAHKYALEKIASELLGVVDSLEMGVAAASEPGVDVARVREGMELTLRMLRQAMEKFHIVEVNPQGEKFDPSRHEAMAAQDSAEHEPNTVMQVVQKGYLLNDRLLRPAMVIVSRAATPPAGGIDEKA